jgi:hypothetical protein
VAAAERETKRRQALVFLAAVAVYGLLVVVARAGSQTLAIGANGGTTRSVQPLPDQ